MKHLLIVLALLVFITCKKKDEDPPAPTPDYADSLVGSYLGQEIRYKQDNSTQEYSNGSKTMTVTKLEKNKIQVSSFTSGPAPIFILSDGGSAKIKLTPQGSGEYGTGWNEYSLTAKQLNIYIIDCQSCGAATRYYYYQATKQ